MRSTLRNPLVLLSVGCMVLSIAYIHGSAQWQKKNYAIHMHEKEYNDITQLLAASNVKMVPSTKNTSESLIQYWKATTSEIEKSSSRIIIRTHLSPVEAMAKIEPSVNHWAYHPRI